MSTTTIQFDWSVNGVPTDAASVVLCDPTSAYGVKRTDTNAVVVAANTAMAHVSAGVYSYTFTDPAPGLTYQYWVTVVYAGATYRFQRSKSAAGAIGLPSYLGLADALNLAANVPDLVAFPTATSNAQTLALARASQKIDAAMKYQGRKYDLTQTQEFPRMAYEAAARVRNWGVMAQPVIPPGYGDVVWDWDAVNLVQIVPQKVLLATLYEADSILQGTRNERLNEQHDGVQGTSAGGVAESYRPRNQSPGVRTRLCADAWQLMSFYRVMQGRLM